jgi:CHAT domain-containing protein
MLIAPLEAQGVRFENFSRLIVVPHGQLHYVPFAALIDDRGQFLISKVPVTVAPSASIWYRLQGVANGTDRFVAFADPDLKSRAVPDLPFADQEAGAIAKMEPAGTAAVYRREAATRDRFLSEAPGAGIIHISTHGEFPDDNALDSHAIWLADQGSQGVALRAADIGKVKLAGTSLVALSVCNGGLYRIGPSDEPYGLIPAFLEAGAQNVLGTLWPLDDEFGRDFMIEFYKGLAGGPAAAFQRACLRFIRADDFIRKWAGFVLVGPGRPFAKGQ